MMIATLLAVLKVVATDWRVMAIFLVAFLLYSLAVGTGTMDPVKVPGIAKTVVQPDTLNATCVCSGTTVKPIVNEDPIVPAGFQIVQTQTRIESPRRTVKTYEVYSDPNLVYRIQSCIYGTGSPKVQGG